MSLPSEAESQHRSSWVRPSPTASVQAQPPRPRRTLTLSPAVLDRVRGVMDRRATRLRTTEPQSTSQVQSETKRTISTFPDLVLQIMRREALGTPEQSNDEETSIPHVQLEGRKIWEEFNNHATVLEKDLQKFQDAVKELGSSRELTGAARNLRKSISLTSRIFEDNARKLFPRAIGPSKSVRIHNGYSPPKSPRSWPPPTSSSTSANNHVEPRPIHVELKAMEDSIRYLRKAREQFLEFGDIADEDLPLFDFEGDLKYWSLCLERYEGQFESREVQLYIHDLSKELGGRFDDISHCLKEFIDGVPTVRLAQKHAMSNLQSLATIATFFSAVTATTIQYSYAKNDNMVDRAVNVFWFNSLVFSIASALNSFLVLTWRRASYSPRLHIPWWLWIWIRQCPPVFLVVSVVTFLAGLGCFALSSKQANFTSVIVIFSEGISAFGLAALLVWLAYERWSFAQQWHSQLPVFDFTRSFQMKTESVLPTTAPSSSPENPGGCPASDTALLPVTMPGESMIPLTPSQRSDQARRRWSWALQKVSYFLRVGRKELGRELLESRRMDKLDPGLRKLAICHEVARSAAGTETNDIQFDPLGKALAICRNTITMRFDLDTARMVKSRHLIGQARQVVWTSSAGYLVTRKNQAIHVWRPSGGPVSRPHIIRDNSHYILDLPNPGAPASEPPTLLSIEGEPPNKLAILDVKGNEYKGQEFKDIRIQHADIVPDGTRVLLAAEMLHVENVQPAKVLPCRKLMVYNFNNCQIEHEVPLWHDVQHVTVSVSGRWAVVTYKDSLPPQLWLLQSTPSGVRLSLERQFCARERMSTSEYDPSQNVRFSGRAHFINNDRYVLCTTADGKIHIWRRDKAHSIHVHSGLTLEKDKPVQIASNRSSNDDFMFATRSHDGTVRIWKIQDPPGVYIDTMGLSNLNWENNTGATQLVTLSTQSESPQTEQPPVEEVVSANSMDPARLVTSNSQPGSPTVQHEPTDIGSANSMDPAGLVTPIPKRVPSPLQLDLTEIDAENYMSAAGLISLNTLSESPQGSLRIRGLPADSGIGTGEGTGNE